MRVQDEIVFRFIDEGVAASARLLREQAEVCWFYDLDATPSMPEGPIAVNVCARLYNADAFFAVCRRMRLEGAKRVEIGRA